MIKEELDALLYGTESLLPVDIIQARDYLLSEKIDTLYYNNLTIVFYSNKSHSGCFDALEHLLDYLVYDIRQEIIAKRLKIEEI